MGDSSTTGVRSPLHSLTEANLPCISAHRSGLNPFPSFTLNPCKARGRMGRGELIREGFRGIGEGDQFAHGIVFLRNGELRLRVQNGQDIATVNAAHAEAIILDANHPIFFIEN